MKIVVLLLACQSASALLLRRPVTSNVVRRGRVLRSVEQQIFEKDAIVAACDEYGVWNEAQVLDTTASSLLIHYLGWEDHWDEWVPRDRITNSTMFIADEEAPPMTEAQIATRDRDARLSNDMWQFDQFANKFCAEFVGATARYTITSGDAVVAESAASTIEIRRNDDEERGDAHATWAAEIVETSGLHPFGGGLIRPADFRAAAGVEAAAFGGTAANGDAFTTARLVMAETKECLVCDVWLRIASSLTILRVAYDKDSEQRWVANAASVSRLSAKGSINEPSIESVGTGIYDLHPRMREMAVGAALDGSSRGVIELRLDDRLTCAFPSVLLVEDRGLNAAGGGVISLDWAPAALRVQVDRVFARPDTSLASLEITDILVEDVPNYAARPMMDGPGWDK